MICSVGAAGKNGITNMHGMAWAFTEYRVAKSLQTVCAEGNGRKETRGVLSLTSMFVMSSMKAP